MKKTAVVICPGRGTYNAPELGYLHRHHADCADLLGAFDARRQELGQKTLSELDQAQRFSAATHTRGDNASALIYASAICDAKKIHDSFDVVGVTGNSMGWYTALAVAGAVADLDAFEIVNTMGSLMQDSMVGGQTLYPFVDDDWQKVPGLRKDLFARVADIDAKPDHDLAVSIRLGGMLVVAGNDAGLEAFEKNLPVLQSRYPMRLPNHAAFHTSLQMPVASKGQGKLPPALFGTPRTTLVDGRGKLWFPHSCTARDLRNYTLGAQVVEPYDFTLAVQVAAKVFAPDVFIITGPGGTLGGAVAQSLIEISWKGMVSKRGFQTRQKKAPVVLSMGRDEDRVAATSGMPRG